MSPAVLDCEYSSLLYELTFEKHFFSFSDIKRLHFLRSGSFTLERSKARWFAGLVVKIEPLD